MPTHLETTQKSSTYASTSARYAPRVYSTSLKDDLFQTEKLDLPSISQVHRPSDVPFYNHHASQRPLYANDRLPPLPLPQPHQAYSSGTSSPRIGSIGSSAPAGSSYTSSYTTNEPKTPSPGLPSSSLPAPLTQQSPYPPTASYPYAQEYSSMNTGGHDMYYQSHLTSGQAPPPQTVTTNVMAQYPQHQQPPLLHPGHGQYTPTQPSYHYGYGNGLTSPQSVSQVSGPMGQGNVLPLPVMASNQHMQGQAYPQSSGFDTTGQLAPAGMKPRVTATLWEDEGSLCFQVEAKGICVARRDGKHRVGYAMV